MMATWNDSKIESEEEIDTAHMCFMAHSDEASKVNLENSLEDDNLTMDELAQFFKNYKIDMKFLFHKTKNGKRKMIY